MWMELSIDGTCSETSGAMVDGEWKLEGDQLTLTIRDDKGQSIVQRGSSTISGNTQKQVLESQPRELTRKGSASPGRPAIVGVWTYSHPAGGTAYEEYKADGRFLFRLPIRSGACRWSVDGDRLRITAGDQIEDSRWRVTGDTLTLEATGGSNTYHRETVGIIKAQ
jgi:hypothetical protein